MSAQINSVDPKSMSLNDAPGGLRSIRRFKTGGYVSAQAVLADVDCDGILEIVAASDALYAWKPDGSLVAGFPVYGPNYFASRPVVTDINGDGEPEIIVGCDDDSLYAFDNHGDLLPGWPFKTGGDVYSSPVVADLNRDGLPEIVVGSDDGCVYALTPSGSMLAGWPQRTGGFVSASPVAADIDGDGRFEVIAGSWDGSVYVWRHDGELVKGWPQATGHIVWSGAAAADIDADGRLEILVASDGIHAWRCDGTKLTGWPQRTSGFMVGTPSLWTTDSGDPRIIAAGDQLYCWDANGRALGGFPIPLDAFCWHQPQLADVNGDGLAEIIVGTWDGKLAAYSTAGALVCPPYSLNGPVFAAPTVIASNQSHDEIIASSWDGTLRWLKHDPHDSDTGDQPDYAQPTLVLKAGSHDLGTVPESTPLFVQVDGPTSSHGMLHYRKSGETLIHPSPLVIHAGRMTGLIQPYLAGASIELWAEIQHPNGEHVRYPEHGTASLRFSYDLKGRIVRRLAKLGISR